MCPLGALEGVEELLGGYLGLLGFERDKWLSLSTRPSGLTEASLQSGLLVPSLRGTLAAAWFPSAGATPRPVHRYRWPLLPRLGAGPAAGCVSLIQGPPLFQQPHGPRDVPKRVRGRRKVCHLPGASCHLSAARGSLETRGCCLPGDAPRSPRPVGRSAEQGARIAELGARSERGRAGAGAE